MNQDGVWKEAIEYYFEYFLTFFFPEVAADVDHQRGYEFLDKELAEISQGGEVGGRIADVLVKVYLKDGSERWLVIHVEVQGYWEQDFARRVFTCNYRAFDRVRGGCGESGGAGGSLPRLPSAPVRGVPLGLPLLVRVSDCQGAGLSGAVGGVGGER